MATIPQARFEEFLHDIEPSQTTKTNASSAHTNLRDFLKNHKDFRNYWVNDFLSGSYIRDTAIRPRVINNVIARPDVDIIVVTNHSSSDDPKSVVDLLFSVLKEKYSEIRRQTRSVGISTNKVDMDVVPIIPNGNMYLIPDRKQECWIPTNPPGHTAWTTEMNKLSEKRYKPLVKMMKWWRRQNPTISKKPKGFVIECITADCMDLKETYYGELFVSTLERIVNKYFWDVSFNLLPSIADPAVPGNVVTSGMSADAFAGFYNKVKAHAELGRKALDETDPEKATILWRKILGDRFPSTKSTTSKEILPEVISASQFTFPDRPIIPNKPKGFA